MNKFYDFYLLIHGDYDLGRLQKVTWSLFDSKKLTFGPFESRFIGSDEEFVEMLKEVYQRAYKVYMDLRSLIIASYQNDLLPKTLPEFAAKLNISLPPIFNTYIDLKVEAKKLSQKAYAEITGLRLAEAEEAAKVLIALMSAEQPAPVLPQQASQQLFVRLRGMPYSVRKDEIMSFLGGGVEKEDVLLLLDGRGRPNGQAIVRLSTSGDYERAMKKHKERIGSRYIQIFNSSSEEWRSGEREMEEEDSRESSEGQFSAEDLKEMGVLKLRGLPWGTRESEIEAFFEEQGAVRGSVRIERRGGRDTGVAHVLLRSKKDVATAQKKSGQYIGGRYIEVFSATPGDYQRA